MIQKKTLKSRPSTKVTFELPSELSVDDIQLVADFTDWAPLPFERLKSGKWKLQHEVASGRRYQFRYRLVEEGRVRYLNDDEADDFVPNEFGTENAVLAC